MNFTEYPRIFMPANNRRAADNSLHFGSPAILIEAVAAAQAQVNASRRKPVAIRPTFFFVERKPTIVAILRETLREYVYPQHPGMEPTILTGALDEQLAAIVASIQRNKGAQRAIFLLDQYGYSDVPLSSLQLIFRALPNAEVFLTLAVGWISAYLRDPANARDVVHSALGIRSAATEVETWHPNVARKRGEVRNALLYHLARESPAVLVSPSCQQPQGK